MEQFGRLFIVAGVVLLVIGLLFAFGSKLPFRQLDFHYQRGNFNFYFPLGTSIVISVILSLLFALLNRR
jgi:hypothetical protein